MTITEFLLARIAEDEAAAKYCPSRFVSVFMTEEESRSLSAFKAATSQERMLAECAAKRAIIEPFVELANSRDRLIDAYKHAIYKTLLRGVIAPLAAVYADHPDYLPEWAL